MRGDGVVQCEAGREDEREALVRGGLEPVEFPIENIHAVGETIWWTGS